MRSLLFLLPVLLTACAGVTSRPGPVRETPPFLQRGWAFSESYQEYLETTEAGVAPVDFASPVIDGDRIVFGTERLGLMALHKDNGQLLWRQKIKGQTFSSRPLVAQNRVYIGSNEGMFYSYQYDTGSLVWKIEFSAPQRSAPIFANDRLIVGTADESIHALDPSTGKILWTYKRPSFSGTSVYGGGNPAFINGKIWTGFSDGSLVALDPNDGAVTLEKNFRDSIKYTDIDAKPLAWKDSILIVTYDGRLRSLKRDGTTLWEFPAGGAKTPLLTKSGLLVFASSDGTVYCLQPETGKEVWRYALRRGIPTGIAVLENTEKPSVIVSSADQYIYGLDLSDGKEIGRISLGKGSGAYSSLVVDDEQKSVFVLSQFSRLYQLRVGK